MAVEKICQNVLDSVLSDEKGIISCGSCSSFISISTQKWKGVASLPPGLLLPDFLSSLGIHWGCYCLLKVCFCSKKMLLLSCLCLAICTFSYDISHGCDYLIYLSSNLPFVIKFGAQIIICFINWYIYKYISHILYMYYISYMLHISYIYV